MNVAYMRATIRDEIRYELDLDSQIFGAELLAYIELEERLLNSLATTVSNQDLFNQRDQAVLDDAMLHKRLQVVVDDALSTNQQYVRVRIADATGTILGSTDASEIGRLVHDEDFFLDGMRGPFVEFVNGQGIGESISMSVPVIDTQDQVVGVASADVSSSNLVELLDSFRSRHQTIQVRCAKLTQDNMVHYLFSSGDFELFQQDIVEIDEAMSLALAGENGFTENAVDHRGVRVLTVYRPVGYAGWGLVVQVDQADAFRPLQRILVVVVCIGLLIAFIAGAMATTVVQSSLGPIRRLARATRRMADGDYSTRIKVETEDELGELGRDFNTMSETVEQHTFHLEESVKKRTAQLEKSKDQLRSLVIALEHNAALMDRDLEQAEVIQRSLLPRNPPKVPGYSFSGLYVPGKNVGGDVYDVFRIDERHLGLVLADSTGHGVSAAMLTVLFKNRLDIIEQDDDAFRSDQPSPSASEALGLPIQSHSAIPVFARVNEELISDVVGSSMFVTAMFCILDTHSGKFSVASAGHPPLLVLRASGEVQRVSSSGPALGLYPNAKFDEESLVLESGDRVLMYTDGIFNLSGQEPFSLDEVAVHLRDIPRGKTAMRDLLHRITHGSYSADRDDVTMLMIDVSEGENSFDHPSAAIFQDKIEADMSSNHVSQIEYAEDDESLYLSYHGRITWMHGQSLSMTVKDAATDNKRVIIDMTHCEYLDSAMLGTLHETAEFCASLGGKLHIQNVSSDIHETFVELGMRDVLDCISGISLAIPHEREQLLGGSTDTQTQQKWLLRAHEALASLNESNLAEFKDVIEELREDIANSP